MLTAFKEELKRLAVDPLDPFHQKIRDRIGKRATHLVEKRLKQLILLMPGLVRRIHVHWEKSSAGSEIKRLGGFMFIYLYQPKDFLPEDEHGLFGYMDDAYLVLVVYEKVVRAAGHRGAFDQEDEEYLKQIQASKRYIKAVIPKESKKIEVMVDKAIENGEYIDFAEALSAA